VNERYIPHRSIFVSKTPRESRTTVLLVVNFNQIKQYKLIFYVIGFFLLIAVLGYLIADASWDNVMDTLTATEVPSPTPTSITATPQTTSLSDLTKYEFP
jgi:hypothetical protein